MNRKYFEGLVHIIFWVLSGWLIVIGLSVQTHEVNMVNGVETHLVHRDSDSIKSLLICIGINIPLFYLNLYNLLRLESSLHKYKRLTISSFLFLLFFSVYALLHVIILSVHSLRVFITLGSVIFTFYFIVSTLYALSKLFMINERKTQKLIAEKDQYRLTLLRRQLQPHFLFNALNNLLSFVDQQQSPQLANAIYKLSGLLRYVVDESKANWVTVEKEIEFIRNYIGLQQLRFESNEVCCTLRVEGEFNQQTIEPGLFLSFVENAFKFGTLPETNANIDILFDLRTNNQVMFTICNRVFQQPIIPLTNGTGIHAIRERLHFVYPGNHQLVIEQTDVFRVELIINTYDERSNH